MTRARPAFATVLAVAAACLFELLPLRPLLLRSTLSAGQTERVYFEPTDSGVEIRLDQQRGGYMTEVELGPKGELVVPAGRTIALSLDEGESLSISTLADDLAPQLLFGAEAPLSDSPPAGRLVEPRALMVTDATLRHEAWDARRPWAADREVLRHLRQACAPGPNEGARVERRHNTVTVRYGGCGTDISPTASPPSSSRLLVAAGAHPAFVERASGWRRSTQVAWPLVLTAALHLSLFAYGLGFAPTAMALAVLAVLSRWLAAEAMLAWFATLLLALPVGLARLARQRFGQGRRGAAALAVFTLCAELGVGAFAVSHFDAGTFGQERVTHAGDESCSIVGYSTVRGDSLREGSPGLVEDLNERCARCRQRTSRFSREAQTLRWVRQTVCDPALPTPANGEIVFVGGGNDDAFYQPTKVLQIVAGLVGMMRFFAEPLSAAAWEEAFASANERAVSTLADQAADIAAIGRCAQREQRRFWFLHDFLIWDLDRGRSPARQRNFESRRRAAIDAGAEFVDLLEELRDRAGLAWMNDFIHPSAVAQREIADLLCQRLSAPQSDGSSRP